MQEFASRLLDYPARTAAVKSFLEDLRVKHLGDIHALAAAINDHFLWLDVFRYWQDRGWVAPAPHTPMYVFPGENFRDSLTLRELCGEDSPEPPETEDSLGDGVA